MAWWNGDELGHFPIADLFCLDLEIASDICAILAWLGSSPTAVYPDAFDRRADIQEIIGLWKRHHPSA